MQFKTFLKRLDATLFYEYTSETIKDKYKSSDKKETDFTTQTVHRLSFAEDSKLLHQLAKIEQLPIGSPGRLFIESRGLPEHIVNTLRWAPAFKEWTNNLVARKFSGSSIKRDEGRIIIPFFNEEDKFHAYQGRAVGNSDVRYISIILDESIPLIWGLDKLNLKKKVYVFEGVFDACFIPNGIAICGGNFYDLRSVVNDCETTVIWDNEPRSKETKKKMESSIDQGFGVCIWPSWIKSKDVNEMIQNENLTSDGIRAIIDENTYSGIRARTKLIEWSKA
jgi:hypothetical protein